MVLELMQTPHARSSVFRIDQTPKPQRPLCATCNRRHIRRRRRHALALLCRKRDTLIDAPITTHASAASEFASAAGKEMEYAIRKCWIIQRGEVEKRQGIERVACTIVVPSGWSHGQGNVNRHSATIVCRSKRSLSRLLPTQLAPSIKPTFPRYIPERAT